MITKRPIEYKCASMGTVCIIPKGTPVKQCTNLPDPLCYWVDPWPGMSDKAESYHRNYGFLLREDEVEEGVLRSV